MLPIRLSGGIQLELTLNDASDCVIDGSSTIEQLAGKLLDLSIEVASGRVLSKAQELGQDDFIPWKRGVSL